MKKTIKMVNKKSGKVHHTRIDSRKRRSSAFGIFILKVKEFLGL